MRVIYTETGFAALRDDGSMVLDNSGYQQWLTTEQVQAAWDKDSTEIPFDLSQRQEILDDYDGDESMVGSLAYWDGEVWDFGDEVHVIPSAEAFGNPDFLEPIDELPPPGSGGF